MLRSAISKDFLSLSQPEGRVVAVRINRMRRILRADAAVSPAGKQSRQELLLYQQAHHIGAVTGAEVGDASQVFERLRKKVYGAGGWFGAVGRAKGRLLTNLKYLMACVEEVGRIESLRLRIEEAVKGRLSFQDLETAVAETKKQLAEAADEMAAAPIVVFGIA
jgi:hypothetical protein